jgi:hypothetical protein
MIFAGIVACSVGIVFGANLVAFVAILSCLRLRFLQNPDEKRKIELMYVCTTLLFASSMGTFVLALGLAAGKLPINAGLPILRV